MIKLAKNWPWFAAAIIGGMLLYSVSNILLPFIAAMFIAYALSPAVNKLVELKCPRSLATTLIVIGFFVLFGGVLFFAMPFLKNELVRLASALPEYGERIMQTLMPVIDSISSIFVLEDLSGLQDKAAEYLGDMLSWGLNLLATILTSTLALANLISLIVLTPIIAFYLLRDWPKIVSTMKNLLPRKQTKTATNLAESINQTISGYVRGQATACLILSAMYCVGLSIVGLDYAITIGLVTGILSFIPYFGMLIGVGVGMGVALAQFSDWYSIGMVALVFAAGQIIEGNFIAPKLIGDRIGLHPVWVIFALLAGGSLFGFLGILFAMPVAATIGVLVRFSAQKYRTSKFYKGGAKV